MLPSDTGRGGSGLFSDMVPTGSRNRGPPPRTIWAYGYEIAPPLAPARLRSIERLLDEEHSDARGRDRTWASRFVVEERVTHILVVSDSPDQHLAVNRRLEAELEKLEGGFSITPPVEVVDREERESRGPEDPVG